MKAYSKAVKKEMTALMSIESWVVQMVAPMAVYTVDSMVDSKDEQMVVCWVDMTAENKVDEMVF